LTNGESAEPVETEILESHLPTDADYKKFMPDDPLVVHWFDAKSFTRLIRNYVSHGVDMPLGEFIKKFRGFTNRAKASAARESVKGARKLSDLSDADVCALFAEMCKVTKEPSHSVLGSPLGEEHLVGSLRNLYGNGGRAWHKDVKSVLHGAPAVVEVAVVETCWGGGCFIGLNHSPTYEDPLANSSLFHRSGNDEVSGYGIKNFLRDARVLGPEHYETMHSVAVAVHITAAAPTTTDRGKTTLSVDGPRLTNDLAKALWLASKDLYREARKRERDAAAAERDVERRAREWEREERRITKANACYEVMEEAYAYSTGNEALPTTVRDLYYAVRNRIKRFGYDADELDYKYFSQTILPTYRRNVRELPKVVYEPRGILYEPHGGREVRLGTRSVAEYNFPDYVFDKILYIEKNGRVDILQAAKLDERYDMALVGGQGYATEAIRTLLEGAEKGDYQLFVLHDADPDGYGIARTLREETKRMPGYSVDVIDIGLKLEDALAMGKEPETFTRAKKLPAATEEELTEVERGHFVGRPVITKDGKTQWVAKRVELNDLSSPQLVEYVQRKLRENGVRPKVIPPDGVLEKLSDAKYRTLSAGWVTAAINELISTEDIKRDIAEEFVEKFGLGDARRYIEEGFEEDDSLSWREALGAELEEIREEHAAEFKAAVEKKLRERLRDS
jgi:hypothetical protein